MIFLNLIDFDGRPPVEIEYLNFYIKYSQMYFTNTRVTLKKYGFKDLYNQ